MRAVTQRPRQWLAQRSRLRRWAALLGELEEFRGLSPRALRGLAREVEEQYFPAQAFLCHAWEHIDGMLVIESGSANHIFDATGGHPLILEVGRGDSSEKQCLNGWKSTFSLQAIEPVHALWLARAGFDRAVQRFPDIRTHFEEFLDRLNDPQRPGYGG